MVNLSFKIIVVNIILSYRNRISTTLHLFI